MTFACAPSSPLSVRMARACASVRVSLGISHSTPPLNSRLRFSPLKINENTLMSSKAAETPRPIHRLP